MNALLAGLVVALTGLLGALLGYVVGLEEGEATAEKAESRRRDIEDGAERRARDDRRRLAEQLVELIK